MNDFDHINNVLIPMMLLEDDGGKAGGDSAGNAVAGHAAVVLAVSFVLSVAVMTILNYLAMRDDVHSEASENAKSGKSVDGVKGGSRRKRIRPITIVK